MKTEIIVVIIASGASLIIGLINIINNRKISLKQDELELKKTRIDLLENRREKI
jgi:Na+-translocating ferredoxin:NAD+ oxidoreductase RnfG subunit